MDIASVKIFLEVVKLAVLAFKKDNREKLASHIQDLTQRYDFNVEGLVKFATNSYFLTSYGLGGDINSPPAIRRYLSDMVDQNDEVRVIWPIMLVKEYSLVHVVFLLILRKLKQNGVTPVILIQDLFTKNSVHLDITQNKDVELSISVLKKLATKIIGRNIIYLYESDLIKEPEWAKRLMNLFANMNAEDIHQASVKNRAFYGLPGIICSQIAFDRNFISIDGKISEVGWDTYAKWGKKQELNVIFVGEIIGSDGNVADIMGANSMLVSSNLSIATSPVSDLMITERMSILRLIFHLYIFEKNPDLEKTVQFDVANKHNIQTIFYEHLTRMLL
ncbi:hypothetical protein WDZ92_02665 [Nostoc sp. NIES-2111]